MFSRVQHSDDHAVSGPGHVFDPGETALAAPFGRRAFIAASAGAIAATTLATTLATTADAAAVPAGASYYQAVTPVRLADTRTYGQFATRSKDFERVNGSLSRIKIIGSPYALDVPSDAIAVVVSIAVIRNGTQGWVAALPTGSSKVVSNINFENGDGDVANIATVKIGVGGKIDVKSRYPCDVIVDIQGVYRATSEKKREGRLQFLPSTTRALKNERMTPGTWRTVLLPFVSTNAAAVVVNLTVAGCRTQGWLAAAAVRSASRPGVSNLNYAVGDERAVAAIVQLGQQTDGTPSIEIYSNGDAQVFVDVTAYFTGANAGVVTSEEGLFVPIDPNRVMDTRRTSPDFARTGKKRLWPGWTREFELPQGVDGFGARNQMKGLALNATLVTSMQGGFVRVWPARTDRAKVSNLNPTRVGHTVANHVITEVSDRGVEMYARCGGDVIADVAGWYVGPPKAATYSSAAFDPPAPTAPFNWTLSVPRMGLVNLVAPNLVSGDYVVDTGNSWHWTNTGLIGVDNQSIVVFGHRTSKNGPYRLQHNLLVNDRLYIDTRDNRRYEYKFVREQLTGDSPSSILNAARTNSAGTTFTLVACTGSSTIFDDQPRGGIRYRIVSTFVLVGWTDTQALK